METNKSVRIKAERKQISVTHVKVKELLEQQDNASEYIERAVLFYDDFSENDYITRQEVMELLANYVPHDNSFRLSVTKNDVQKILDL